jgi:tetratricopeptide (TPR) repeat protein
LGGYRFADAVLDFDRCIALEPRNVNFYYRRARAYLMLDQMENALADLQTASALQPDNERLAVLREIAARRQRQLGEK